MNTEIWDLYNEINESFLKKCELNNDDENEDEESDIEIESESDTNGKVLKKPDKQICINCKQEDFLIIDSEMIVCTYCGVENEMIIDYYVSYLY